MLLLCGPIETVSHAARRPDVPHPYFKLQTQSSHQEKTQMSVFSRWAGVAVGVWL